MLPHFVCAYFEDALSVLLVKGFAMHDDIMGMQLIPLSIFYLCFLVALNWVREENAAIPARRKAK